MSKVWNGSHLFFKAFAEILIQLLRFLKSVWMTFRTTLGEYFAMVAFANIFVIDYKNETNMKVAASNINI